MAIAKDMLCERCGSVLSAVTLTCVRGEYCKPKPDDALVAKHGRHLPQTVREALDEKRAQRKGTVTSLVLCKRELFYCPALGHSPSDSVYPVSTESAQREAEFFGVPFYEE